MQLALALEADDGPPAPAALEAGAAPSPGVTRWELDLAIGSTVLEDGRIVAWIQYPACIDTAWPWWAPGPYGRRAFSGVY